MNTVFITGVSSGLGHGLAKAYLETGSTVYGLSRRTPKDLTQQNNFHFLAADLEDLKSIPAQINKLLQKVPKLDLVILNAGLLGEIKDLTEIDQSTLNRLMNVNVWANKVICDTLFKNKIDIPQVVAISSGASINGNRGWGGYAISKAALNMLVMLYAAERPETHFSSLAPGLIDTAMQDYIFNHPDPEKFAVLKKLKAARGTPSMPNSDDASKIVIEFIPKLLSAPNGSYQDVRLPIKQ